MKKRRLKKFYLSGFLLVMFAAWTVLVRFVDVQPIAPNDTQVGFATLNIFIHRLTGVNMFLYDLTDFLGLIPIGFAFYFAIWGLLQLVKRKSIFKVDRNIILLGLFYVVLFAVFLLFELYPINYRPLLIEENLEASYPSSTTMLVVFVMLTASMQLKVRLNNSLMQKTASILIYVFTAFTVVARLISGVHWFTDIVGGLFFSLGLAVMYSALTLKNDL